MLRIYFLQQWFPVGPAAEDAVYDSEAMRRFTRVELSEEWCRTSRRSCVPPLAGGTPADGGDVRAVNTLLTEKRLVAAGRDDRDPRSSRPELDQERDEDRDPR